jgi:hypothetical protein
MLGITHKEGKKTNFRNAYMAFVIENEELYTP